MTERVGEKTPAFAGATGKRTQGHRKEECSCLQRDDTKGRMTERRVAKEQVIKKEENGESFRGSFNEN
ncbi:hypothetical protein H5U35_10615 [Candidatus Aerophobetes bacterium]|nr:hypothetical protein [Candidatus Aerophobetes bacterium]